MVKIEVMQIVFVNIPKLFSGKAVVTKYDAKWDKVDLLLDSGREYKAVKSTLFSSSVTSQFQLTGEIACEEYIALLWQKNELQQHIYKCDVTFTDSVYEMGLGFTRFAMRFVIARSREAAERRVSDYFNDFFDRRGANVRVKNVRNVKAALNPFIDTYSSRESIIDHFEYQ